MSQKNYNFDLNRFERVYDSLDKAHDRSHMERVRSYAVELATIYYPKFLKLVYVAATVHDIGLVGGKEGHEKRAAQIIRDDAELQKLFSKKQIELLAKAIEEHRATTGQPTSILAKIISDADRGSDTTAQAFQRAYYYRKSISPEMLHDKILISAAVHLSEKFGINGHGRRIYFPETEKKMEDTYTPIIQAHNKSDWKFFNDLLNK